MIVHSRAGWMGLVWRLDSDQVSVIVVGKQDSDIVRYLELGNVSLYLARWKG